jgi:hypothetical protein
MKTLIALVFFASVSAVQASVLAECSGRGVNISITSGANAREVIVVINGVEATGKRRMEYGAVVYQLPSMKLEILGNHRQMGNPIGYLTRGTKESTVVCSQGVDIEKIAGDTELY